MTAVAVGAAIFAESREWLAGPTARKASRASVTSGADGIRLRYDYLARIADERARLRVLPETAAAEVAEVEVGSEEGWTSGRRRLGAELVVDLALPGHGEHCFTARVFAPDGRPVPEAGARLAITRTHACATGIPATQTVAVKVVEEVGGERRNRLHPLVEKGTPLPAEGVERFRAAADLRAGGEGRIDLELFQQAEGVPEPELNLFVGAFRIEASGLPEHGRVRRGDEVVCRWRMDDNGLLGCALEVPSVGLSFGTGRYYADTAGHRSFEGEEGAALAGHMLDVAAEELDALEDAVGRTADAALDRQRDRLARQRQALADAADADARRSVSEEARHVRQEMSRLRHDPTNRAAVLRRAVEELRRSFPRELGGDVDPALARRVGQLLDNAWHELALENPQACDAAERLLEQARGLKWRELFGRPEFLQGYFRHLATESHLAIDRALHAKLVRQGEQAVRGEDWPALRRTIGELVDNQVRIAAADRPARELASLSRG